MRHGDRSRNETVNSDETGRMRTGTLIQDPYEEMDEGAADSGRSALPPS